MLHSLFVISFNMKHQRCNASVKMHTSNKCMHESIEQIHESRECKQQTCRELMQAAEIQAVVQKIQAVVLKPIANKNVDHIVSMLVSMVEYRSP